MVNVYRVFFKIYIFDDNNNILDLFFLKYVIYCFSSGIELLMYLYIFFGEKRYVCVQQLEEVRGLVCSREIERY